MNRLLLSTAFLASLAVPASAALLTIDAFDNGVLVGSNSSITGSDLLNVTTDPAFSLLNVVASGAPLLAAPDLSSATLDVTSAAVTVPHTLVIDVFQIGLSGRAARLQSTFTENDLVGAAGIGPTTESTFVNGTPLASHTFGVGVDDSSFGPVGGFSPDVFSDAHQYSIRFDALGQSANDTIQLAGTIPEPSTWAMIALGFAAMLWLTRGKRQSIGLTA